MDLLLTLIIHVVEDVLRVLGVSAEVPSSLVAVARFDDVGRRVHGARLHHAERHLVGGPGATRERASGSEAHDFSNETVKEGALPFMGAEITTRVKTPSGVV